MTRLGDHRHVVAALRVVVGDDDDGADAGPRKLQRVLRVPLAGPGSIRRRVPPTVPARVRVLLALDDVDAARAYRGEVIESVDDLARVAQAVHPLARVREVGPTLIEALRLQAHALVEQRAGLVGVVVRGDDARGRPAVPTVRVVAQNLAPRQVDRSDDGLVLTAGPAL